MRKTRSADGIAPPHQQLGGSGSRLYAPVFDRHQVEVVLYQRTAVVECGGSALIDRDPGLEDATQTAVPTRSITSQPMSPFSV